jgi:hypothetical protein
MKSNWINVGEKADKITLEMVAEGFTLDETVTDIVNDTVDQKIHQSKQYLSAFKPTKFRECPPHGTYFDFSFNALMRACRPLYWPDISEAL